MNSRDSFKLIYEIVSLIIIIKALLAWYFLLGGFIWFLIKKIKVYIKGRSNDEAATKAIIWFNLINGFFTRSSPHKPQIKVPFEDSFWNWYLGLQNGQ